MKKGIVIGLIVFVFTLIPFMVYKNTFHITGSTPKNGSRNVPTSTKIEIKFSKKLSTSQPSDVLVISPKVDGKTIINNNSITFIPSGTYKTKTKYTVKINVLSYDNKKLNKTLSFVALFTSFNDLSDSDSSEAINNSSSFLKTYPILKNIPYDTDNYKIDYTFSETTTGDQEKDINITITMFAVLNRPEQYEDFKNQIIKSKTEALRFLSDNGIDYSRYRVDFLPKDDTGKFIGDL